MMGLAPWLAAGIFFVTLGMIAVMAARGITDVITLTVLSFLLFYGFRAVLLVTGLDVPSPSELFPSATFPMDLTRALLGASLFLLAAAVGIYVTTRPDMRGFAPFFVPRAPDAGRQLRATMFFTACSVVISVALLAKFGGPSALITAAKVDKALAGLYVFRVFPAIGSMLAAGAFLDLRRLPGRRSAASLCLLCAGLNAAAVFLWGSRSLIVVTVLVVVLGLRRQGVDLRQASMVRNALAVLVAGVLVFVVAGSLRVARDTLTHGQTQDVYANASVWRQASLATNAVYLDAAVLAFRDIPDTFPSRGGTDFANGVAGVVPRSIWPGKPGNIAAGSWFRQQYEPKIVNGWPMGAPALWYLDFGWLGVPLGGLLSGLAIGMISARQRRVVESGHNIAAAAAAGIFVLGLGWDNETLISIVLWRSRCGWVACYLRSDSEGGGGAPAARPGTPTRVWINSPRRMARPWAQTAPIVAPTSCWQELPAAVLLT